MTVLAVGMAVMDFVMEVDRFPSEAVKYRARDAVPVGGGCAANAAFAVARLGGAARLAARLGDDLIGDLIAADLASAGIDTRGLHRQEGARSSFSSILVDRTGERQIVNFRGDGLTEATDWILGPADAVLVDTRWSSGAAAGLAMAEKLGVPGIVDAESPVDPEVIGRATHVAFSRRGLADVAGTEDIAAGLAAADALLSGVVIVTDGANGAFYARGGQIEHVPGFAVEVRDTLAAGDIWHGAFALMLSEARPLREAIEFANACAALKCREFGGRSGCPSRRVVEDLINGSA